METHEADPGAPAFSQRQDLQRLPTPERETQAVTGMAMSQLREQAREESECCDGPENDGPEKPDTASRQGDDAPRRDGDGRRVKRR